MIAEMGILVMTNLESRGFAMRLRTLLACLLGLNGSVAWGRPLPVGESTTTVSYTTATELGTETVSFSNSLDYTSQNVSDAVSLVDAPNIWSFNSLNAFGRRTMLAQNGMPVIDAELESLIAHAFFKGTIGDDYFPDLIENGSITIQLDTITFDQPVYLDDSTLMVHAFWKLEQSNELFEPYINIHDHHVPSGVFRDFDNFSGIVFFEEPVPTYRLSDSAVDWTISGNGTTTLSLSVTFPYDLLKNFEEIGQVVGPGLPAPQGFLEPFHFHIEYLVTSDPATLRLPLLPVPAENPITEPKRVLGKILFWDEQLSSNNMVACGTCHLLSVAGSDPRLGLNPGPDGTFNTVDDIIGSFGVPRADAGNTPVKDPIYAWDPQVTGRATPSMLGSQYFSELFWDGRAGSTFLDPDTGLVSIASGGAFENQALGPLSSDAEMAHESRTWASVTAKLTTAAPLALATDLPADVSSALAIRNNYPDLFAEAFGDSAITAERIAWAIATYERTLYPSETPWDRFMAGQSGAMTASQIEGWEFFQSTECAECHVPPLFTDHSFRNIGLRPVGEDGGRQDVTGLHEDRGRFKVPMLRNTGLKKKFMHNGQIKRVQDVLAYYIGAYSPQFADNLDPLIPIDIPLPKMGPLADFLRNGLTDPRVVAETFPFDYPTLRGERMADVHALTDCMSGPGGEPSPTPPRLLGECLDLFDTDGDSDVDMTDYQSLLWNFPRR
jgi:cytochrome c peroxidase